MLDCSRSIPRPHVIYVGSVDNGHEGAALQWALDNTNWERFLFLQDSVVVTEPGLFDKIDATPGSICLHDVPGHFGCFLGVYERRILEGLGVPEMASRGDAIKHEATWCGTYADRCSDLVCLDSPGGSRSEVERHGRNNLPYDTGWLVKYRGNWGQA